MKKHVDKQRKNNAGGVTGKGFLPGKSGNASGRPRGQSISDSLRDLLDEKEIRVTLSKGKSIEYRLDKTVRETIAAILISRALNGDIKAIEIILDRCEGRITLPVELPRVEDIFIRIENDDGTLAIAPGQSNEKKC